MINKVALDNSVNPSLNEVKNKEIDKAASEFESIFIYYMLKTMRESVMKADLFGDNKSEEIYRGMLDEELSKAVANAGGIGLKDTIVKGIASYNIWDNDGLQNEKPPSISQPPLNPPLLKGGKEGSSYSIGGKVFSMPIKGEISSLYGVRRDPFIGEERFHHGIDIAAREGTAVHPAMDGVVMFSGEKEGYGNIVEIRHDNGSITRYAHNQKNTVQEGDLVTTSDVIALVGKTGRTTGPHLHFEVKIEGFAVNPMDMINFG